MRLPKKILYDLIILNHQTQDAPYISFSKIAHIPARVKDVRNWLISNMGKDFLLQSCVPVSTAINLDEATLFIAYNNYTNEVLYTVKLKKPIG